MAVTYEEWMSDGDALMWNIERDPVLRSTVLSVWILDRSPDLERFEATFDRAAEKIPRLRQRVIADSLGVATPRWEEDPLFDRTYHLRRMRAPGDGG
ncbi:MAG: diacylglycerol O-acyltransferase, partial [bacterium]|nr:diacylglycerol O-acyltransferase [bacterium]